MNYNRANLEICKAMTKGELVRGQKVKAIDGDKMIIIPNNGFYGYIFEKGDIVFSLDKVRFIDEKTHIIPFEAITPDNELKLTQDMKILPYQKQIARKFTRSDGAEAWVNRDFLSNLELSTTTFYQGKESKISAIVAVEYNMPVMVILPIRMCE